MSDSAMGSWKPASVVADELHVSQSAGGSSLISPTFACSHAPVPSSEFSSRTPRQCLVGSENADRDRLDTKVDR